MEHKSTSELPEDRGIPLQQPSSTAKHLDFNAPFLSVRLLNEQPTVNGNGRVPPVPKKYFKLSSELSAESLRKPGAVPFMWEQTPGKPKMKENEEAVYSPPPALPPGRSARAPFAHLERDSHNISSERYDNLDHQTFLEHDMDAIVQKQSEGSDSCSEQSSAKLAKLAALQFNGTGAFPRAASVRIRIPLGEPKLAAKPQNYSPQSPSENDDTLSDSMERMPPTDAFANSCRVTMDELDRRRFLCHTGREARNFIMYRFLPAAKAMARDFLPRVQSRRPMQEAPSRPLPLTPRPPPFLTRETESSPKEDDEPEGISKVCGLISSRFKAIFLHLNRSLRNSSRHTTKDKAPSSLSRSRKLETVIYKDASSDTDDEDVVAREVQASLRQRRVETKSCRSCAASASAWITGECSDSPLNHQHVPEAGEAPNHNLLFYDTVSMLSSQATDRSGSVSPFRNGKSTFPFNEAKGFLGLPNDRCNRVVHVDATSDSFEDPGASVGNDFSSRDSSHSSARKGHSTSNQRGGKVFCADMIGQIRMKSPFPEKTAAAEEHENGGIYKHETSDELQDDLDESRTLESVQAFDSRFDYRRVCNGFSVSNECRMGVRASGSNSDVTCNNRLKIWPASKARGWPFGISSKLSLASPREKAWVEAADSALDGLSPPLPKSPTESWLLKTIPSKPSSPLMSYLGTAATKYQLGSLSGPAARWEIMVKGSHVQPGHLRFSKELLHGSSNCMESGQP